MPAFPTTGELPSEAKSKELKAQLEADFKIAKKNGDLKKQQQQWLTISTGGEPAGKIYAINRLLKVMSLVAVIIAPAVVTFSVGDSANPVLSVAISLVAVAIIIGAIVMSKRRSTTISDTPAETSVA